MKALPSLAVTTLLLACLPWSNTYAVDPKSDLWRHRFDAENASLNFGRGYSDSTSSADLAWGEAYVLEAYLMMYQSYGATEYLNKFVDHVDRMMAHLNDLDGDQYAGWQTSIYTVQKITNGGFEQSAPSAPAAGWVRWQSTPSTAFRTTAAGDVYEGSAALAVETNPSAGWQVVEQALASYVAGGVYEVSFYGKVANTGPGAAAGRLEIYDATAGQVLANKMFTDTSWSGYSLTFKAPPAGHTVKITCYHDNYAIAGATSFFDKVSVKLLAEYLVHDGMILAPIASFVQTVKQDPQLAAYLTKANEYQSMMEGVPNTANKGIVGKWWFSTWNDTPPVYLVANDEIAGVPGYLTGTSLPHNQYLAWARVMATLYAVTGKPEYLTRAVELATTFKVNLTPYGNGVRWHYADQIVAADNGRVLSNEDTSHANLDVQAVFDLAQAGIVFGSAELVALRNTLLDVMWLPELNQFALDVVGTQGPTHLDSYTRQGMLTYSDHMFSMINLAAASSAVWGRVRSVYQKVENDGFETASTADATLPDQWQRWQSTSATAFRSTNPAHAFAGKAGLVVKTNPGGGWQVVQQQLDLVCSTEYRVNFWGKTDGTSGVQGRVDVIDETAGAVVLNTVQFDAPTWTYKEFKFTSPACPTGASAFHVVKLYVYQNSHLIPNGTVFVDEINVGLAGGHQLLTLAGLAHWNPERGVNRDFEIVDVADATLPARWTRWQSQPSTAYRSTASGDALSGKAGLVVKTDPAVGWQVAEQVIGYTPGTQYQVSFHGKTNGVVGGRVEVFDATAGTVLNNAFFSGTSWTHGTFNFTAPSVAGHTVKLTCYHDNWAVAGGKAVFDRVEVTKLP
jgi:hypothetical protein